jgi:hypothetical protein
VGVEREIEMRRAWWVLAIAGCGSPTEIECTYSPHQPATRIAQAPAPVAVAPTPTREACPKKRTPMNWKYEMGFVNPMDIADVPQQTCLVVEPGRVLCRGRIVSMDGEATPDDDRLRLRYGNGRDWVQIYGITDAVEIVVDPFSACARLRSGKVACWGYEYSNGVREPHRPRVIPNVTNATALTSVATAIVNGVVVRWSGGYGQHLSPAEPFDCAP